LEYDSDEISATKNTEDLLQDKNSEIAPGAFTPNKTVDLLAKLNQFKKDPFVKKKDVKREIGDKEKASQSKDYLDNARSKLMQSLNYAGNKISVIPQKTRHILGFKSSHEKKVKPT